MSYIGTLVKYCDNAKSIEQETQEEVTLHNNPTLHPRSGMWIPIYNYLYQNSYRVSI